MAAPEIRAALRAALRAIGDLERLTSRATLGIAHARDLVALRGCLAPIDTVPVSAGFPAIEAVFNAWVAEHPGWEWSFGNVYDPADGVTPLGWWA